VQGHHTGDVLGRDLFQVLEDYDISEKLFCITSDSAGNNGTMCKTLSRLLEDSKGITWSASEHQIRCMNHVINLAVQEFLESIKALAPDDENDKHKNDDEDDKDNNEVMDDDTTLPEGFALAMYKIRSIIKVITHYCYIKASLDICQSHVVCNIY
jgi:hypothetical protein